MFTKIAVDLMEHQQRVIDKLNDDRHGLIAQHSLGSGKTLTALKALEDYKNKNNGKGLFITPASLVDNVRKEIVKHKLPLEIGKDLDVMSYERAANHAHELLEDNPSFLVFDEAHRLRNPTKRTRRLVPLIDKANKVLMLTGTAGYNHPSDIASLISLINKESPLPTKHTDFSNRYIDDLRWKLRSQHKAELKRELNKYLDIYNSPTNSSDFPSVEYKDLYIPMSEAQHKAYQIAEEAIPAKLRESVRKNLPIGLQDSTNLNMFATGVRQASVSPMHHDVTTTPEDSTKLMQALQNAITASQGKTGFRGVAYSNYIDAGLNPYEKLLRKTKIKPLLFTGALTKDQKKAIIDEYNSNDTDPKMLLLSSSGGEGLDLKRTRLMQVLEPHFNKAKIKQVIGRGARYKSHTDLPEEDRNMLVERYYATMPKTWINKIFHTKPTTAIDSYLDNMANKKQTLIDEMNNL